MNNTESGAKELHRYFSARTYAALDGSAVTAKGGDELCSEAFRDAMRDLAGGVTIVTVGKGDDISGFTATAVNSLSATPPRLLVCINRGSSSWAILEKYQHFAVNIVASCDQTLADRFAGRGGLQGALRYGDARWTTLCSDTPILTSSLAALDCEIDETIFRYDHAIVIGRVKAVQIFNQKKPLVYWQGGYHQFQSSGDPSMIVQAATR